jgi:hypothetical protein
MRDFDEREIAAQPLPCERLAGYKVPQGDPAGRGAAPEPAPARSCGAQLKKLI